QRADGRILLGPVSQRERMKGPQLEHAIVLGQLEGAREQGVELGGSTLFGGYAQQVNQRAPMPGLQRQDSLERGPRIQKGASPERITMEEHLTQLVPALDIIGVGRHQGAI